MSNFKRATVVGRRSQQDILAPLRDAQIINSKPVLPAEIFSMVLDYLPAADLIWTARVSKRMKEMVYDDSRWVQKLQLMGCWNEAEARKRVEAAWRKRAGSQATDPTKAADRTGIGVGDGQGIHHASEKSTTIFEATSAGHQETRPGKRMQDQEDQDLNDGFDAVTLSPSHPLSMSTAFQAQDAMSRLQIFTQIRSVRGSARQEYGKVHKALSSFYEDAINCRDHTSAVVFRAYRDPDQQAKMLSNILKYSGSDTSLGWRDRTKKLDDLIGAFETAVTREFEQGLEAGDIDGRLRKYACVLTSLNGGQKGVELFITNNPIIVRKRDLGNPMDCLRIGASGKVSLEESFSFFSNLSSALNEQISIIDRIFPVTVSAEIPFLEQVGTDVLMEYLSTLFDEVHRQNLESFLIAVSGTYQQAIELAGSLRPSNDSGEDFFESLYSVIAKAFELHVDLYLNEEYAFFKRKSDTEVSQWERQLSEQDASMQSLYMSNVNRQADKRDFMTSFKKVVMMPVNVLPSFPMSSPFGGKSATAKALVNGDNLEVARPTQSQNSSRPVTPNAIDKSGRPTTPFAEPPTTELAARTAIMTSRLEGIRSLFSIEVALNLVHAAKSSIERMAVFFKSGSQFGEDARKQCQLIFVLLLQILGTRHIKAGFDKAVDHLANYNPKEIRDHGHTGVAPLVTFLELVNVGDLIQQMLDVFYEQELVATKLTDRNDFLDPAVKEKKRFEQMLDERVAAGLNKGIEVLMSEVEFVCATTQKAEDFNPGSTGAAENNVMDIGPSETASRIVEIVSSHTKMLVGSTDKNMLDVFNQEVGVRLFTTLCKHLKMQRISVLGSIKLISDMNHYFTYIQTLRNQTLLQYFIALRELAQIYLVDPSDAKELATIIADGDRFHGIFRAEEVYEYAERRADWYSVRPKVERAMYGIGCSVM